MSDALAQYLAKNYLNADPPPKQKKKKRKHAASEGLIIADDDAPGWSTPAAADTTPDDAPIVAGTSAAFRRAKSNWITTNTSSTAADTAAADAILASNTDGRARSPSPAVVGDAAALKMSNGTFAGLQTAESLAAQLAAAAREEARRAAAQPDPDPARAHETIYRDASGRVINLSRARAEARRKEREEEERRRREREMQRGEVQRREAERRREELREARYAGIARYADDAEMNRELREKARWGDPGMGFLKAAGKQDGYQGAFEPNRFGIRPGRRWDGVDRGNGFERRWFQAQNRRRELQERRYTSQMDID